jgi:hypothetical protein
MTAFFCKTHKEEQQATLSQMDLTRLKVTIQIVGEQSQMQSLRLSQKLVVMDYKILSFHQMMKTEF